MLEQHISSLTIATPGRGLVEITRQVRDRVAQSAIRQGLVTLFLRHTSASLLLQENADPDAIPVIGGAPVLGQGIYLWEHRRMGHAREVVVHIVGEACG